MYKQEAVYARRRLDERINSVKSDPEGRFKGLEQEIKTLSLALIALRLDDAHTDAASEDTERLRAEVKRLRAALDAAGNRLIEHDLEDDLDLELCDHSDRCTGHVHGPCDCGAESLAGPSAVC